MANNLSSNITNKVARIFLDEFDAKRVVSKSVNTTLIKGSDFTPEFGDEIRIKRPHDYRSISTPDGDITGRSKNSVTSGSAKAVVQNYITVPIDWTNREEALELDQLREIIAPAAQRAVTDLETRFAKYCIQNANLSYGTPGNPVSAWSDVAGAGALMESIGVPSGDWFYLLNPFTQTTLAGVQNALNAADSLVRTAWENAQISPSFAGMRVLSASTLGTYTTGAGATRAGTLDSAPTATYAAHKDTMIQDLAVTGFQANLEIAAGEVIEVTGRYRLNLATREPMVGANGQQVLWRGVVTESVTLDASGEGTLKIAGPAINEANGQYNTVVAPLEAGDVVTLLGSASTIYQPNLFMHRNAFGIGTVRLPKLYATDTIGTTKDGISIRITRYSDGDANSQALRMDLLPAFATYNPFFAGQGYGVAS